ncbi:restriction endonuclease [Amycolatopsis ruanii]|uniref:restriction endonuclease n=1 Tax=Amycolatopsis TaxID=1813 RepID=UPI000E284BED
MQRIRERFAGHGLADLVAEILRAEGYHCTVSTPGPDGGMDIYAGRGPLLLAQVKSNEGPIGSQVVTQLHGVMGTHGADQGLLVAWGGLNREARRHLGNHPRPSVRRERRDRPVAADLRPLTGKRPD